MARLVSDTVDILRTRVRQLGEIAINEDVATEILGICQQIANIALQRVTTSTAFATTGGQQLYTTRTDIASDVADLVSISEGNRELNEVENLEDLSAYDVDWFSATAAANFLAWAKFGRDYFIVYPAKTGASSVNVVYVTDTTIYTDYSALTTEEMEVSDEDVELVLKLAEAVLLIRARNPETLVTKITALVDLLKAKTNV